VVLGGLLQDEYADNQDKVPLLGDIPLLGNLFKSQSRSRKKTNLMVFIRPLVVRDASGTDSLSMDRYEQMRSQQQSAQPAPNRLLPLNDAPVLQPRAPLLTPTPLPMPPAAPAVGVP
jgi:general secretion pathway protein D